MFYSEYKDFKIIDDLITSYLSDFVSDRRRNRIEAILEMRTRYITIVLEDIYQSQNASAVLRTCECMGVQDVHIVENYNLYNVNPMVVKGSDRWLTINKYNQSEENSLDAVRKLKSEGYRIVATSLHDKNVGLYEFDLSKGKCAIVFGNEHQGVSQCILREADEYLRIPMCGFTQSLNISVSAGIILSQLTYRLKQESIAWQLTPDEKKELHSEWIRKSVKNPEMLIKRFLEENKIL